MRPTTWVQIGLGLALALVAAGFAALTPELSETQPPAPHRVLLGMLVITGYIAISAWLVKRSKPRMAPSGSSPERLVCYASQTGAAEAIARQSAAALDCACVSLEAVTADQLRHASTALFIVSTTGDGDAPDPARGFVTGLLSETLDLHGLRYGVLALGDRRYDRYCAFGHVVDRWLAAQAARALHAPIEMDNGDPAALAAWRATLQRLGADTQAVQTDHGTTWRIETVVPLNPDSPGNLACLVRLRPEGELPNWAAGDLVDLRPCNGRTIIDAWMAQAGIVANEQDTPAWRQRLADRRLEPLAALRQPLTPAAAATRLEPLPWRSYSIASMPSDGAIELVVRQMFDPDGALGPGSAWLTRDARPGDKTQLRLRNNPGFHLPETNQPLLLIGNGTGIAGLRALLKARIERGQHRNWLVYGERSPTADRWFGAELDAWKAAGYLRRLDLCFSRGGEPSGYVQDQLEQAADDVRRWIADGACIMVCGSQAGMSQGVHAALTRILGEGQLNAVTEEHRYRRDVY